MSKTYTFFSNPEAGPVLIEGRSDMFVGAVVDEEKSEATRRVLHGFPGATTGRKMVPAFTDAPLVLTYKDTEVLSAYYARACRDGDLLAGDAATLKACGASDAMMVPQGRLDAWKKLIDDKAKAKADAKADAEKAAAAAEKAARAQKPTPPTPNTPPASPPPAAA